MKKFRTWYNSEIDEVEVIRETAKYVILASDGRRWAKRTEDYYNFFDTWQEAKTFLIEQTAAERKTNRSRNLSGLRY